MDVGVRLRDGAAGVTRAAPFSSGTVMQQWDYSVLLIPTGDMQGLANELAHSGEEGFELVGLMPAMVTPPPVAKLNGRGVLEEVNIKQAPMPHIMCFLKRPKVPVKANPYNLAPGEELT